MLLFALPMLLIAAAIKLTSRGPVVHWSRRIGKGNQEFLMPKFRTMRTDAPQLATHLLSEPARWITPVGVLLRRTSLDELPQLWTVLKGEMSIVGPRPALFNQFDLMEQRTRCGVHQLVPGLTGWAQVHGRDNLSIGQKVLLDELYLRHRSLWLDICVILITVKKAVRGDDIATGSTSGAYRCEIVADRLDTRSSKQKAA
jgi:O-antigen biosynthesis protein WbqP